MDISKQYIEMCRGANKILPERSVEPWDYWYMQAGDLDAFEVMVVTLLPGQGPSVREHDGYKLLFPLYRQDQLQEMVIVDRTIDTFRGVIASRLSRFWHWYLFTADEFDSMEQLWLAFVMKEKHDKIWNGKWIDRV